MSRPEPQDLKDHPCFRATNLGANKLSHRSGGFGDTCERCGTEIAGPNNQPVSGVLSWRPIPRPRPYQSGSLNEAIFEITRDVNMTDRIVALISAT